MNLPSVKGRLVLNEPIAALTSLRVGGRAAIFAEPHGEEDLAALARLITAEGLPCFVLGRGSNVLVSDDGFPGLVLHLGSFFDWVRGEGQVIHAGASTDLPRLSNYAARRGLSGLEFAVAIPATVGGAVRMNAGAHGAAISTVLDSARIFHLTGTALEILTASDLDLEYRSSSLRADDIVCSATFILKPADRDGIAERMQSNRRHRAQTQPSAAPNAGSMFANPPGASAGGLIEAAGLKGSKVGGAEVSHVHSNFFLARPGATAQNVYDLMARVQTRVREQSGILLVPEIRLFGAFDTSANLTFSDKGPTDPVPQGGAN